MKGSTHSSLFLDRNTWPSSNSNLNNLPEQKASYPNGTVHPQWHQALGILPQNHLTWTWLLSSPRIWATEEPSGLNGVKWTRKDCNMLRDRGFMEVGGEGRITLPGCPRHGSRTGERPVIIWRPLGGCASVYMHGCALQCKQKKWLWMDVILTKSLLGWSQWTWSSVW